MVSDVAIASQALVTAMGAACGQVQMSWGGCGEVEVIKGSIWSIKIDDKGGLWGIICFRMGDASIIFAFSWVKGG